MNTEQQHAKIPLWVFTALAIGVIFGYAIKNFTSGKRTFYTNAKMSELDEVLNYVNEKYVDSVDVKEIESRAISEALEELDPHSYYLSKEVLARENEQIDGLYEGVGLEFFILNDTIQIVSAMSGGPSEEVGIRGGDKIITVNDSIVAGNGITNSQVMKLLKGKRNTNVSVGIQRGDNEELLNFEITRAPITLNSIDIAYMLSENTGYIKISRFSSKTFREFRIELDKLVNQDMENLIIDLRGNPGGVMKDALQILDQLLDGEKTLLTVKGRKYKEEVYPAYLNGLFEKGKLAVLIDESSASASEIVAGAIQDWDRGVIIGRRSFGKGLVQNTYQLSNGGALRLTVARYYTPSGRSIQRAYDEGVEGYYEDYYNRSTNGELFSRDSIKVDSALVKKTLVSNRNVYGGGGITPDIFVPIDTTSSNSFTTAVLSKRLATEFMYDYYNKNENSLSAFPDSQVFDDQFFISNSMYNQFVDTVKSAYPDKEFTTVEINEAKVELSNFIKALLARQLFDDKGYYIVSNEDDEMILKALSVFENNEYETVLKSASE